MNELAWQAGLKASEVSFPPLVLKVLEFTRHVVHRHHELSIIIDCPKSRFVLKRLVDTQEKVQRVLFLRISEIVSVMPFDGCHQFR